MFWAASSSEAIFGAVVAISSERESENKGERSLRVMMGVHFLPPFRSLSWAKGNKAHWPSLPHTIPFSIYTPTLIQIVTK